MSQGFVKFHNIDPVLFSIGPVSIRWYGLMYLIGFIFAIQFANYRARRSDNDWTRNEVSDLLFPCFFGGVFGGRIGYVLFYNFDLFWKDPLHLFKVWMGGMSFHGGLVGVISVIFWYAKKNERSFFDVADFIAPLVPFGLGAGRIGNFINGELWGRVTHVPWAVIFPNAGPFFRHPSQLYEFVLEGIVLFLVLHYFVKKLPPPGLISGLFLAGYGILRFFVEYFREPDSHLGLLGGFISMGQVLSLPMVVSGVLVILCSYRFQRQ
ncbi:prolipoprotein diacylglyceryl transferase [Candidatus Photodesmus blepharus]|uniref:prolipoprotein diacylglyceryl transferase n=1 Tax=Candidatus Photodesmus blepharonis TaxID=1179155 RepID=UPI00054DD2AE|nr:prolipoprotein diacylglyceryl transferase [Candidatus Photodesmus blepharus]